MSRHDGSRSRAVPAAYEWSITIFAIAVYVLVIAVAAVAAVGLPATAAGLALCQFGFEQWVQSQTSFFAAHGTLTNVLFSGLVPVALLIKMMRGEVRLRNYPAVGWTVAALFLFAVFSLFWSVSLHDSLGAWKDEAPYTLLFAALCPLLLSSSRDLNRILMAVLTLGSLTTCLLLATSQFEGRQVILQGMISANGVGPAGGNPLATASLAGWVCLIGLLLNFRGLARFWQVLRWVIVAAGLVLTIRSGSRGQMIALLLASVAFLPVSRRIKSIPGFITAVLGIVILVGCAYWAFDQFAANTKRWDVEGMISVYQGSRLEYTKELLTYWLSAGPLRWLMGLGNSASFAPFILGSYPHFVPGEILAEEGIVGFAIYVVALIMGVRCYVASYRLVWEDPVARGRLAALGALCAFEFMISLKQGSMIGNAPFFAFLTMIGCQELVLRREAAAADGEQELPLYDDDYHGGVEAALAADGWAAGQW